MQARIPALLLLAPLLVACESGVRIGSFDNPFGGSQRLASATARPAPSTIEAAPTTRVETAPLSSVTSQDLAPPPGTQAAPGVPIDPQPGLQEQAKVAVAEPPKPAAPTAEVPVARTTQTSVTGNWVAREASGTSCKVTLSSSPKLDLYGASTSGCQSKDMQRIVAWELRGDDVYLYQPGGAVAARLKAKGRLMDGTLAQSGAPIVLSK